MKSAIQPVSAAVACKHSAGTVATVSSRRESYDQELRSGITKTGERLSPITFTLVTPRRLRPGALAPAHQTRALAAINDGSRELLDARHAFGVSTKFTGGESRFAVQL